MRLTNKQKSAKKGALTRQYNRVRNLWLAALRSGEYKRIMGALSNGDSKNPRYCPLGVLCELAVKEGIIKSYPKFGYYLPTVVKTWAGLTTERGSYYVG